MWLRLLASILFVAVLWRLFRLAMALRFSKILREEHIAAEVARGRHLVTELPLASEDVAFFFEDPEGFYWGENSVRKSDLASARVLMNGGSLASASGPSGKRFAEVASVPEEYEGRERWEVEGLLEDGSTFRVPCGSLREGVSREAALRVFESMKDVLSRG